MREHKHPALHYGAFAIGVVLGVLAFWLLLRGSALQASTAAFIAVSVWYAAVGLRFGIAGIAAGLPSLVFFSIVLLFPIQYRVDREFFAVTAQLIPVLFIAFAIESGVVRHRTRGEVKVLAVLLAVLLALGQAAALFGLAAESDVRRSKAEVWHLTMAVAAVTAGFLSIIVSMLIRQPEELPADSAEPAHSATQAAKPILPPRSRVQSSIEGLLIITGIAAWMVLRRIGCRKNPE